MLVDSADLAAIVTQRDRARSTAVDATVLLADALAKLANCEARIERAIRHLSVPATTSTTTVIRILTGEDQTS